MDFYGTEELYKKVEALMLDLILECPFMVNNKRFLNISVKSLGVDKFWGPTGCGPCTIR